MRPSECVRSETGVEHTSCLFVQHRTMTNINLLVGKPNILVKLHTHIPTLISDLATTNWIISQVDRYKLQMSQAICK